MSDACGGCCIEFCGLFCVAGTGMLGNWCDTTTYGVDGCCNRNHSGCCGSCCSDSFNEDAFDKQVQKDMEHTRDPNAPPPQQPGPSQEMAVPTSSG
ncbi:hypothetical protein BDQ12DRAFT_129184 [Crucibulum laeve]|uniref:Uncharacterized protein n=1 Tax=Crucibulum laeve TaxID=68775 RepID=A0A5C3LRW7_9AGAR|nr:hypothetical protein BDQ12DRAFT_129184 [Crucibulum laeve]